MRSDLLPRQVNVTSGVYLKQFGSVNMPDLDEGSGDEEEVGRMECHTIRSTFPFYGLEVPIGFPVTIHV